MNGKSNDPSDSLKNGEMVSDDGTVLLWAKNRHDYATPIQIVSLQIKTPSKFGWKSSPRSGFEQPGQLFFTHFSALASLSPTLLEIVDADCPITEFLQRLQIKKREKNDENYFNRLLFLRVYESGIDENEFRFIIQRAPNLSVVEFFESRFEKAAQRQFILNELINLRQLKAFDFAYSFEGAELNEWFKKLRPFLRIVRFGGPPGVKYTDFKAINVGLPVVEFVAMQDLDPCLPADETVKVDVSWRRDFFNRCCHMFPAMKYFFMDYKIFDTVFVYDDDTKQTLAYVRDFFKRMKFVCMAILVYCPDAEMKASLNVAVKFLENECEIRAEKKEFFCGASEISAPPNFALLVLGDQCHARTERLIEMVVSQRNTTPDLRHFCYVMDMDAFLKSDVEITFGGADKDLVEKTYREKHISIAGEYIDDSTLNRFSSG